MISCTKFQVDLEARPHCLLHCDVFLRVAVSIRCVEPGRLSVYKVTSALVLAIVFVSLLK